MQQTSINVLARPVLAHPGVAALKSLALPGLGQWHNGEINKAAWWLLAFAFVNVPAVVLVALYLPPVWMMPALVLCLLLGLALWASSAVDAWRVARRAALRDPDALLAEADAAVPTPLWRMRGVTVLLIVLCDFIALPLLMGAVREHQVQAFRIPSTSMAPTLLPGDFVFADMRYACVGCRAPVSRGDVAVFSNPNDRTALYVKRVVALPGDRVQIDRGDVHVNGVKLEPVQGTMPAFTGTAAPVAPQFPSAAAPEFIVPPGRVFVLGDQRSNSVDSRQFGTVPLQDVVGRVRQVWLSWGDGGMRWERLGRMVR